MISLTELAWSQILSLVSLSVGLDSGLESNYIMLGKGSIKIHSNGIHFILILKIMGGKFPLLSITEP